MKTIKNKIEEVLRKGIERNNVLPLDWAMDRIEPILKEHEKEAQKIIDETLKNKIEKALNEGYTDGYTDATKNAQKLLDETLNDFCEELKEEISNENEALRKNNTIWRISQDELNDKWEETTHKIIDKLKQKHGGKG